MKTIRIFSLLFIFTIQIALFAQDKAQMQFGNDFHIASGGLGNLTEMFLGNQWKYDANGDLAALVRIKVTGMSTSEMAKLEIKGSANAGFGRKQFLEKDQQWIIAMSTGKGMFIEMTHPIYGTSSRLSLPELKASKIYDVTLINNHTVTIVVHSLPKGADVYLDNNHCGKTPCNIPGQRLGKHHLKLLFGNQVKEQIIDVEEKHTLFDDFDFRKRQKLNIVSNPTGAAIYIDDKMIGKAPINGYEVLTGPHTFKAVLNASQVDEQTINVISQSVIELQPVKKGNVEIFTKYAGRPVSAELVVDNQNSYNEQNSYRINLPYGWHSLRVTYGSKSKEKRIHINKPELSHTFKLSAKNDFVWPWQREYDTAPLGFTLSYVYKQLVTKGENERLKENGVWDDGKGKSLHGIQAGINLQPCFKFGLGLYTGLFYEFYYSSNDNYDYDKFMEHCGYIPVHLYYQIPFAKKIALSTHGGLGFSYAFYGMYKPKDDTYDNMTDFYGKDYYPKRFNMTMDIGASLRLGPIQLNFQYSKGINDHKSYSILGDYKTTQNKYTIGISTAISGN